MNFLEKLNYLMKKNSLNKSTLSKACDIPYTTIDGWYKKGYEGLKLTTLRKLSNFFGTSLDFWANDDTPILTTSSNKDLFIEKKDEVELLRDYRTLNELTKIYIRGVTKGFAVSEKVANDKGETITFPNTINSTEELIKSFNELEPEHQQAMLEFLEQLAEQENKN